MNKTFFVFSWIPVILLKLVLAGIGLIAVPFALIGKSQESFESHGRYFNKMWWLWDNKEEGCPDWWMKKSSEKWYTKYWPRWWWFAIRNPVNGFRWIIEEPKDFEVEGNWEEESLEAANLIEKNRTEAHRWVYSGWLAGYRKLWLTSNTTYSEFWIGWKVGSRVPGLGFTIQLRRNRKIGT